MNRLRFAFALFCSLLTSLAPAQQIPHAQDKPPNEPRDPQTAAKMMTVPEGFTVEVVASEPDIVNPVAMAIDEQGRFWITESLEYPRREPGPGRDRVKILEDTDGDGKADKFTVFLDGLNIPSGVQVGHGGVWIANSPDILFVPDADRDGKPDGPAQVVVTGFGRTDTHELPNSLTWGPDGWLYGLNGVFNHSHVKYHPDNPNFAKAEAEKHPGWPLTCAMFRIHPRTREFQVFCEGTSNPWGIAFNDEGDAFVSACVIDHLWHLVETGYYHRQGGPYPPHTWKIESIVKHKHQKAAYCGITWFDSDAYPEQYRKKLYMGNIHGGCINVDSIQRNGSTYAGSGEPDFLTANDAWFMPVVQKTGPDGCLYVLDWYDRYHCYQDANRDPAGIDRLKGRLYRVRYKGEDVGSAVRTATVPFDLAKDSDDKLIELLGNPNVWTRETAQRLLQERGTPAIHDQLQKVIDAPATPRQHRRHAAFALVGCPRPAGAPAARIARDDDATLRAWQIRADMNDPVRKAEIIQEMAKIPESMPWDWMPEMTRGQMSPQALLQEAIAVGKLPYNPHTFGIALAILVIAKDDPLIPRIVWQNIHPFLEDHPNDIAKLLTKTRFVEDERVALLFPRIIERLLARKEFAAKPIGDLFLLVKDAHPQVARDMLTSLAAKVQSGELKDENLKQLKATLADALQPMLGVESQHPLRLEASLLALSWNDRGAVGTARSLVHNPQEAPARRIAAYRALIASQDGCVAQLAREIFSKGDVEPPAFLGDAFSALGRSESPEIADAVIKYFGKFPSDVQPRAIELLTQRPVWAKLLLAAIGDKKIHAAAINVNQARRLNDLKDPELKELLAKHWGQVREGRSLDRDKVIADMRRLIRSTPGDAHKGQEVYKKICAQCHKIYGEGAEVGPEITLNGRNDYTQLLSNVFDPSLVIGAGYRSYTVATDEGRVINGLLVEDSPQRVVLKVQGGKQEIIPRDQIEDFKVSEISLMPEGIEKQYTPQELIDLFAFLTLDKPPADPTARRLPGVTDIVPRESTNPADFASIFQEVAPGFTKVTSGEGGVALLKEFRGRPGVVRTHPVSRDQPAEVSGMFQIPAGKKTTLVIEVSHDPRGDWRLVMGNSSGRLLDEMVAKETCKDGWGRYTFDMTRFAGQEIQIRMWNQANDWSYEFGYWGMVGLAVE